MTNNGMTLLVLVPTWGPHQVLAKFQDDAFLRRKHHRSSVTLTAR